MRILRNFHDVPEAGRGAVVALGNFDGLHQGHRAVIGEAGRIALHRGAPLGVLTFEPHPRRFFQPGTVPFRLTPFRPKMRLLAEFGVDIVYSLHFGPDIAGRLAPAFVADVLVNGLNVSHLVVGPNFVFGKGRRGNAYVLGQMAAREGFGFTEVEAATDGGPAAEAAEEAPVEEGAAEEAAADAPAAEEPAAEAAPEPEAAEEEATEEPEAEPEAEPETEPEGEEEAE